MDSPAAPVDQGSEPLRGRLERFAQLLSLGLHPVAAARDAEYPEADSPPTFAANARKRSNRKSVRSRVAYLLRQEEAVLAEKRHRLESRQWQWHESDIEDFYEDVQVPRHDAEGAILRDADGHPMMRWVKELKPFSAMSREQRMCIESLTFTDSGRPNLKLYSKADANKELRKLNGLDKQRDGDVGNEWSRMSDSELFAELARQANALGISVNLELGGPK